MPASPDQPKDQPKAGPSPWAAVRCGLALAALVAATAWPIILIGVQRGRMASDQLFFHEIVVRVFRRDLPTPDLSNYLSATTPGYHLSIALGSLALGESRWMLQVLGSVFAIGLVGLLAWACVRRAGTVLAVALALPIAASLYVWPTAVWLLPDSAGWLGVLGVLLLALSDRQTAGRWLLAALVLAGLVLVRQVHLWAAAMLWVSAWLGSSILERQTDSLRSELALVTSDVPTRLKRTLVAIACTLPAFAVVAGFAALWGGLTPPAFAANASTGQVAHQGLNLATPAFVLALFGALGAFFAAPLAKPSLKLLKHSPVSIITAVFVGLAISLAVPTTFDKDAGRWTGLWNLVAKLPTVGHASPLIVALAIAGSIVLLVLGVSVDRRTRWVLFAAVVGFKAAQSANPQLWQRYVEPFVLIVLAIGVASLVRTRTLGKLERVGLVAGPTVLAAMFAGLTALSVIRATPMDVEAITQETEAYLAGDGPPPSPAYVRENTQTAEPDPDPEPGSR